MDEFKKYIQEHKEELDADNPPDIPWNAIYSRIKTIPDSRLKLVFIKILAAASVIGLVGICLYLLVFKAPVPGNSISRKPTEKVLPQPIDDSAKTPTQTETPSYTTATTKTTTQRKLYQRRKRQTGLPDGIPMGNIFAACRAEVTERVKKIRRLPVFPENLAYLDDFRNTYSALSQEENILYSKLATENWTPVLYQDMLALYQDKLGLLSRLEMQILKLNSFIDQGRIATDTLAFEHLTL